jgi:hypothetical protein
LQRSKEYLQRSKEKGGVEMCIVEEEVRENEPQEGEGGRSHTPGMY